MIRCLKDGQIVLRPVDDHDDLREGPSSAYANCAPRPKLHGNEVLLLNTSSEHPDAKWEIRDGDWLRG